MFHKKLSSHRHGQHAHEKMLYITCHQGNTNQNHNDIPPHTSENGEKFLTRQETTNVGEDVEKREPSCTVGGNVQPLWKTVWRFLKELKIDLPYEVQRYSATAGDLPQRSDAVKRWDTSTPGLIAVVSTIAKLWKEPQCPSEDEWMKKMWPMYTMEYYSAIRNDKYPPFASMRMELEGIMLSEVTQLEKDKHYMASFIRGI